MDVHHGPLLAARTGLITRQGVRRERNCSSYCVLTSLCSPESCPWCWTLVSAVTAPHWTTQTGVSNPTWPLCDGLVCVLAKGVLAALLQNKRQLLLSYWSTQNHHQPDDSVSPVRQQQKNIYIYIHIIFLKISFYGNFLMLLKSLFFLLNQQTHFHQLTVSRSCYSRYDCVQGKG